MDRSLEFSDFDVPTATTRNVVARTKARSTGSRAARRIGARTEVVADATLATISLEYVGSSGPVGTSPRASASTGYVVLGRCARRTSPDVATSPTDHALRMEHVRGIAPPRRLWIDVETLQRTRRDREADSSRPVRMFIDGFVACREQQRHDQRSLHGLATEPKSIRRLRIEDVPA